MNIVFARKPTLGSWLIRFGTWSQWSHCAILADAKVIDATMQHGVAERPFVEFVSEYPDHLMVSVECDESQALAFARSQIGKPYDWLAIVGFVFRRGWSCGDKWFCSEFVEAALKAGGRQRFREELPRITPRDVWAVSP